MVVGTPGRMLDMIGKRALKTEHVGMLVMDETDELLGRGFLDQIREIIISLPTTIQIVVSSCTFPPDMLELCSKLMLDPVRILHRRD